MDSREDVYFADAERRGLSADSLRVVIRVRSLLAELTPAGARPDKTVVFPEKGGCDLLIEHVSLPGLVLAIGVGGDRATVYWAQHSDPEWKDELDATRNDVQAVAVLGGDDEPSLKAFLCAVRRQLKAPLECVDILTLGKRTAIEVWLPAAYDAQKTSRRVWRRRTARLSPAWPTREMRVRGAVSFLEPSLPPDWSITESHARG